MNWILSRMKEPSSYAAAGGAVVGIGVLVSQPVVIVVGIVGVSSFRLSCLCRRHCNKCHCFQFYGCGQNASNRLLSINRC